MADTSVSGHVASPQRAGSRNRLLHWLADPRVQGWAARFPLTRRLVRREGAALFDVIAGFCQSQVLLALVRLDVFDRLLDRPMTVAALAQVCAVPPDRMHILVQAGIALKLLKRRRGGQITLTTRGAALAGVPGLQGMIAHHDVLYRDLADPVAFFRGETDTELAHFWPYVFGAAGAADPTVAATYSTLMADSQALVAADTLATVPLGDVRHLLDVGGGTGAFLAAAAQAHPDLRMTLFDLPAVVPAARDRFAAAGCADRVTITPGSFRDDPLPVGADAICLVRVLYDHADATVIDLLAKVYAALPPGGRLLVSEPMSGGARPDIAGDVYFALYCTAMRTGRARSADEIGTLLAGAGFTAVTAHKPRRSFVTSVVTAVKPT